MEKELELESSGTELGDSAAVDVVMFISRPTKLDEAPHLHLILLSI